MLDEKRVSRKTGWLLVIGIIVLSILWSVYGGTVGAQADPPPVTPEISATWWWATPTPTPVVVRPIPLSPCKISPGCALLPIVRTP